MAPMDITLRQDKTDFAPREAVEGALQWRLESPPHRIDLSLLWYTTGRGTQDVAVVETLTINGPSSAGSKNLAFTLPEGPYTFSGKLISITWALEATSFPSKDTVRQEIVVSPTRRQILLTGNR